MATTKKTEPTEEAQEPRVSITIPFGAGYDVPTFRAYGTVDEVIEETRKAAGLAVRGSGKTLFEVATSAALHAHALVNGNTIGAKPATTGQGVKEKPAEKKAATKSIASKARSSQPEENSNDIEALVAGAATQKALADVYKAHKDSITDEQLKLFSARKAELAKEGK